MKKETAGPAVVFPVHLYDRNQSKVRVEGIINSLLPKNYKIVKDEDGPDISCHEYPLRNLVGLLNYEAAYSSGHFARQVAEFVTIDDDMFVHDDLTSFRRIAQDFKDRYGRFDLEEATKDVPVYRSNVPEDKKLHVKDFTESQIMEAFEQMKERPRPNLNMPQSDESCKIKRVCDPEEYKQQSWFRELESSLSLFNALQRRMAELEKQKHDHKQIEMNETAAELDWREKIRERLQGLLDLVDEQPSEDGSLPSEDRLDEALAKFFSQ
tara:strand:+ start:1309 stop:2109 length:801 start_codon:yes stop_codon:yes gene_type:complete